MSAVIRVTQIAISSMFVAFCPSSGFAQKAPAPEQAPARPGVNSPAKDAPQTVVKRPVEASPFTANGVHTRLNPPGSLEEPGGGQGRVGKSFAKLTLGGGDYWITGRIVVSAGINQQDEPVVEQDAFNLVEVLTFSQPVTEIWARPVYVRCALAVNDPGQQGDSFHQQYTELDWTDAYISPFDEMTMILQAPLSIAGITSLGGARAENVELICSATYRGYEADPHYWRYNIVLTSPRLTALKVDKITVYEGE